MTDLIPRFKVKNLHWVLRLSPKQESVMSEKQGVHLNAFSWLKSLFFFSVGVCHV